MAANTDRLFPEFPPVSTEQWQSTITKDLKGKDPATLLWKTEDGITVKPFYRSEDAPNPPAIPAKGRPGWRVLYEIEVTDPAEANAAARRALAKGAEEVVFRGEALSASLADGIDAPVHFRAGSGAGGVLQALAGSATARRGSVDYWPVADAALVKLALKKSPELVPVVVRTEEYHNAGATTVEELAFGLAAGIEAVDAVGPENAKAIAFEFAAGSNYFFEIAKLRAARLLWAQVLQAYGASAPMNLFTRTSTWSQTVYDPYNNLLRGTTEAMSAAMGGTDALTVVPFDAPYRTPDDFSRHLALNTQLILRDEAYMDKVSDPAAGSWYIESLTESIAREAWKLMQEVEAKGGLTAAAAFVDETIGKSRGTRAKLIAQRRRVFVGTNQYPNLSESVLKQIEKQPSAARGAAPFEQLRLDTERYKDKHGRVPNVLLLTLGDLKMRRARADYITNFFGVSGFAISEPPAFATPEAAADYAKEARADILVLCSSDPEYPQIAGPILERLRAAGVETPVLVAGYPADSIEALKAAGITDFIHVKSDPVATLTGWQKKLGVIA